MPMPPPRFADDAALMMAIVNRLQQEIARAVHKKEVKDLLFNAGVDPNGTTPEEFEQHVKSEIARWGSVIKSQNIKPE